MAVQTGQEMELQSTIAFERFLAISPSASYEGQTSKLQGVYAAEGPRERAHICFQQRYLLGPETPGLQKNSFWGSQGI